MHCGDQRHLGLRLGYVPARAVGEVSDQGTTLRASDLHNARATILNPFNMMTILHLENDCGICARPSATTMLTWLWLQCSLNSKYIPLQLCWREVAELFVSLLLASSILHMVNTLGNAFFWYSCIYINQNSNLNMFSMRNISCKSFNSMWPGDDI